MMSHIQDKLLLKYELSVWIFLLLTHCSEGQYQMIGPTQPVVAMFGDDIVLPCRLEPVVDATARTVEWSRPDLKQRIIHFRRDSVDLLKEQNPSYTRRTSLAISNLKSGDISLKLSKVKLSDTGTYKCTIAKFGAESAVELVVGSISSPEIEVSMDSSSVELECKSAGWYPEPEVLWLDGDGNLLASGPTETVRGPDDLYTVSIKAALEKKHSSKLTCRVQQQNISQTRETVVHVSADLFMVHSNLSTRITMSMAACFLTAAVVVFIVWKFGENRPKSQKEMWMMGNNGELELLMEEQRDRGQSMSGSEKMKYLKMKKAKLDEELQKNEEELEHVKQVIEVFTDQKDVLKKQKDKLLSLQEKEKMKVKEVEMKKDPVLNKDRKQEKREKAKEEATWKEKHHKELLENTEKLLESTDEMIVKMTERKGKLEKNEEQILKHLKSTEQEIEELQEKLEELERKEDKDNPPLDKQTIEQQQERTHVELDSPEEQQNNPY